MTRVFTEAGEHMPVTVLKLDNVQVLAQRTDEKNGYTALQLGAGTRKANQHVARRAAEFRRRQGGAQAQGGRVPGEPGKPDRGRRGDHRRPLRQGPARRRHRHQPGQGFPGRHEALEFRAACAPRTACPSCTAATARPASARIPARCSRARRWPATWATCRSRRRTWRSCRPTRTAGLMLVRGAVPGTKGGWVLVRDAVKRALPEGCAQARRRSARPAGTLPPRRDAASAEQAS